MSFFWPIALIVGSNILYQICAKSVPSTMNPFATLTITYFVGAIVSGVFYLIISRNGNLLSEYKALNWAPIVLGMVIVGLEVGYIYAFKIGWEVSTTAIVQSSFLAVALIFVGFFLYHEAISFNKCLGVIICLIGLFFINR